jgi:DNA-binding CsgD family transcriptional regulator
MFHNTNPQTEKIFNLTKALWNSILNDSNQTDDFNIEFINKFPLLDIVDTTNTTIAIYNYRKFHPEYTTENVKDIIGITKEELLSGGSKLLYSLLQTGHTDFPLNLARQLKCIFEDKNYTKNSNLLATISGLKLKHPKKGIIRIVIQQYFIENDAQNLPIRIIGTMRDVTHLIKDDFYFIRSIYGDKHQYVRVYHSQEDSHVSKNDIISVREKEVLPLLAQGKEADEIAKILGISSNTVRNHRQNMLDRLGAKDTTALLELAHICHII